MANNAMSAVHALGGSRPPGPRGIPFLGILPGLLRDPLKLYEDLARYGEVVAYRVGRIRAFMINRPEYIGEVFQHDNVTFTRSVFHERIKSLFGDGLVTSEGEIWQQHRRMMQPAFQKNRMGVYVPLIREETSRLLGDWSTAARQGSSVNATTALTRITQTLAVRILFRADIDKSTLDAARAALATINSELYKQVIFGWWKYLPLPGNARYRRATRQIERIMQEVVERKAIRGGERNDLLAMLMQARASDPRKA